MSPALSSTESEGARPAASFYAVSMSEMAVVIMAGVACRVDLAVDQSGGRAEVDNSPVMFVRAKPVMAVAAMGLVPMSPPTEVLPVLVMPDLVRSANPPAVPR